MPTNNILSHFRPFFAVFIFYSTFLLFFARYGQKLNIACNVEHAHHLICNANPHRITINSGYRSGSSPDDRKSLDDNVVSRLVSYPGFFFPLQTQSASATSFVIFPRNTRKSYCNITTNFNLNTHAHSAQNKKYITQYYTVLCYQFELYHIN